MSRARALCYYARDDARVTPRYGERRDVALLRLREKRRYDMPRVPRQDAAIRRQRWCRCWCLPRWCCCASDMPRGARERLSPIWCYVMRYVARDMRERDVTRYYVCLRDALLPHAIARYMRCVRWAKRYFEKMRAAADDERALLLRYAAMRYLCRADAAHDAPDYVCCRRRLLTRVLWVYVMMSLQSALFSRRDKDDVVTRRVVESARARRVQCSACRQARISLIHFFIFIN